MPAGAERNHAVYAELEEHGRKYSSHAGYFRHRQTLTLDLSAVTPTDIAPNEAAQTVTFTLRIVKGDPGPTAEEMAAVWVDVWATGNGEPIAEMTGVRCDVTASLHWASWRSALQPRLFAFHAAGPGPI